MFSYTRSGGPCFWLSPTHLKGWKGKLENVSLQWVRRTCYERRHLLPGKSHKNVSFFTYIIQCGDKITPEWGCEKQFVFENVPRSKNKRKNCERKCKEVGCIILETCFWKFLNKWNINLSKPTGHVMYQQFNIQQLYALPTPYLCVLYLSENKQRLVPLTA